MPFQNFNLAESMNAASNLAKTSVALQTYSDKKKHGDAVKQARQEAIDGTPKAIKALMKLDPEGATKIIAGLSALDKRSRDNVKFQAEQTATQMLWVEQAETPEEKSARFDQVVDQMKAGGREDAEQWRGKYSPDLTQNWIMKAMALDDINEQFAFGQLKAGKDDDGNPIYFMTNKAAQAKEVEGVKPTDKEMTHAGSATKEWSMKAGDSNSIRSAAYALYSGTYDPATGRVSGIQKEQEKNALAIAERGSEIYRKAKGKISHTEAAAKAARELGIDVPNANPMSIKDYLEAQRTTK